MTWLTLTSESDPKRTWWPCYPPISCRTSKVAGFSVAFCGPPGCRLPT